MLYKIILPLLCVSMLVGCSVGKSFRQDLEDNKVLFCPLKDGKYLCVINTDYDDGAQWFVIQGGYHNRLLGHSLTAMSEVYQMVPSPDEKYLAVMSVGEGHPYVEVFMLSNFLKLDHRKKIQKINLVGEINPYPGTAYIVEWQGDSLVLGSDMPLDRLDKKERTVNPASPGERRKIEEDIEVRRYLWNPVTDEIRPY